MNLEKENFETNIGLLSVNFNQNCECIAIGTEKGFQIFNSDPLREKTHKEFDQGGIGHIEMMFRSNFLALVGGGKNPKFPPNKVLIWDDLKSKPVYELEFRSVVKSVRLRRDRIVVVLANKTFVYSFGGIPQKLYTFDTTLNNKGLVALSQTQNRGLLAIPGNQKGHVQLIDVGVNQDCFLDSNYNSASSSLANSMVATSIAQPIVSTIAAHTTQLSCIALNKEGTRLATASEKGTLLRVFDTSSGNLLHEFRRGVDRAEIFCISFNEESTRLCVSSDKGTIHIFNLVLMDGFQQDKHQRNKSNEIRHNSGNRQSSFSLLKNILPTYFASEWSFASYQLLNESKCICGFSPGSDSNAILVLCSDGGYFRILFDPRAGGQCSRDVYKRFYTP